MPLQLSDLRSDFTLTLGYLNLALNNMALDSSIYVTNLTKLRHLLKTCFDSSSVIYSSDLYKKQKTKLNRKCITKCSLNKTNNKNKTMYAIARRVLNRHD